MLAMQVIQPRRKSGDAGYRSLYLSHAERALYHLSYTPLANRARPGSNQGPFGLRPNALPLSYVPTPGEPNKRHGEVAEWSKALRSGRSLFGGVGSNPTLTSFLAHNLTV